MILVLDLHDASMQLTWAAVHMVEPVTCQAHRRLTLQPSDLDGGALLR